MDSQAITYDAIGNMLSDGTHTNVWEHGRQLESVTMHTDVVEGECMEDGYDAASGATSIIVFTGGNRVVSGTQTVIATAQVIHGGVDITEALPDSAFTWTIDSGRTSEDATWNANYQGMKEVELEAADMNGDVQIACSVEGDAATFGSIAIGSDFAVSYTRSAADAGDTLSLSSGILSVETASNTYSLDNGSLKVESGFTGTVTASATVFAERPAKTVEFSYNLDGMRAEKKVTRLGVETTTYYTYSGTKLTHLVCGTDSMHFFYDAQGRPAIVRYDNGSTTSNYTYVHNLQGDIVGILDSSGALVVEYHYDAWGKSISTAGTLASTLGVLSPFRYRGYVYDGETGYYYLRSRYYDPGLKRFISADNRIQKGLLGLNVFGYCNNSPSVFTDSNGTSSVSYEDDMPTVEPEMPVPLPTEKLEQQYTDPTPAPTLSPSETELNPVASATPESIREVKDYIAISYDSCTPYKVEIRISVLIENGIPILIGNPEAVISECNRPFSAEIASSNVTASLENGVVTVEANLKVDIYFDVLFGKALRIPVPFWQHDLKIKEYFHE